VRIARPAALVGVAITLLLAAWMMASQPFAAPDEASHYLRALNIANGHLLGPRVPYPRFPWLTPPQLAFADHDTRGVLVPAPMSPPNVACLDDRPNASGACVEPDPTGDYYPIAYMLPAAVLTTVHHVGTGLWLSRAASALPCLVFFLVAVLLLASDSVWSLLGLLVATTPMVLFVTSVINPNGLEIAASLSLAAASLRIARRPDGSPHWVWAAFTLSGAVTILAWQAGPGFALADVLVAVALLGPGGIGRLWRSSASRLEASFAVLLTALVLYLFYSSYSGVGHSSTFGIHPFFKSLGHGIHQLTYVLHDSVGVFGALTVRLPGAAYWVWWLLVVGLLVGALWLGRRADRLLALAVTLLAMLFPVLAYAWVYRFSGFGMQGRYVLPVIMLIPLVAGELIYRRLQNGAPRQAPRSVLASMIGVIAAFQLFAWWVNARDSAGRPHAFWFLDNALWRPPLGWGIWTLLASLGAAALAVVAAREALVSRPRANRGW
jgi:hypothetical protein